MSQPTAGAAPTAASVLFNLPEYEVLDVVRDPDGGRRAVISTPVSEAACPDCGVLSSRVHQRTRQRLGDLPFDGALEVVWVKKRWCVPSNCARGARSPNTPRRSRPEPG